MTEKIPLLVLLGPTAVGKTRLSLELARSLDCEIVSGDSMQVYRGMDIGTAKASPEERALVPHHLIDIVNPDYPFSAAEFKERAQEAIADIHSRGKLPFIVGGTGLYIESLCYDYGFNQAGSDEAYRNELQRFAEASGFQALHDRLREVDEASAERLHPNDVRRVIRALEVYRMTGKPLSAHLAEQERVSPYQLCLIGLTMDRAILYKRIEERIDAMMRDGLAEEVHRLLLLGYDRGLISMQGLGYKEIAAYWAGESDLPAAVELLKMNTRRFAKRQLSWFRHMREIAWTDVTEAANFAAHLQEIHGIIAKKFPLKDHH